MKSESKFILFFLGTVVGVCWLVSQLLTKYTTFLLIHFIDTCSQLSRSLASPQFLVVSPALSLFALIGTYSILKITASALKISQKKRQFIDTQIAPSKKLKQVLQHIRLPLPLQNIILVNNSRVEAFTVGFFSPKIILTKGLVAKLSKKELEAVLYHEYYHIKGSHSLILLFATIVTSIFFFLPFLRDVFDSMKTEFEYQADDFAKKMQQTEKHVVQALRILVITPVETVFAPNFVTPVANRVAKLRGRKISSDSFTFLRMAISFLVVLVTFGLMVMPTTQRVRADEQILSSFTVCNQEKVCSVYCQSGDISLPENMSTEPDGLHSLSTAY